MSSEGSSEEDRIGNTEEDPPEPNISSSDDEGIENTNMKDLDFDYRTPAEKMARGNKEREVGNTLFKAEKYREAKKAYDTAFVYIYTSKEEWDELDDATRKAINLYKLPCHLNRGLCKMRYGDYEEAHWDFNEALGLDPGNTKGMYRRGLAQLKMCQKDVEKEKKSEWWDLDKVEQGCEKAREDLMKACRKAPKDMMIRKAIQELTALREEVRKHRKKYNADQRKLYSSFITNLDKDNKKKKIIEDEEIYNDMPNLERIRIK